MKASIPYKTGFFYEHRISTILIFLVARLLLGLPFLAVSLAQEKPVFQKLERGVYAFIGVRGNANAGFILTDEGVIIVDSQMNEDLAKEMLSEIRRHSSLPIL